jgi:tetratricopeptide (TPR) repeat protein
LYNLEQVPQETENLVSSQQTRAADMEQELARIEAAMMTMERAAADLTAEDRRALQSLGYTAGGWDVTGAMPEISSLPAPANMISTLAMIKQAKRLLRRRRYSEALMLFKKAVEQDPDNISFQFDLGKALYRARAYAQAGDILKHALETAPDYLDLDLRVRIHTLLAAVLMDSGQPEKALAYAEQALALDPESVNALNSTAWILSTHAWDASAHKQGLAYALQMMQLGAQYDISALDTLAAAYAANGDYSNAAVTAGRAWQMALDAGRKVLAKDIKQRLARYRAGRPFWADR